MASMSGSAISSSSVQPLLRLKEDAKGAAALTAAVRLGDAVLVGEGLRPVELPRGHRRDLDLRRQVGVLLDPAQRGASSSQGFGRGDGELHSRQDHRLRRDARRAEDADAQLRHLDRGQDAAVPVMRSACSAAEAPAPTIRTSTFSDAIPSS